MSAVNKFNRNEVYRQKFRAKHSPYRTSMLLMGVWFLFHLFLTLTELSLISFLDPETQALIQSSKIYLAYKWTNPFYLLMYLIG